MKGVTENKSIQSPTLKDLSQLKKQLSQYS